LAVRRQRPARAVGQQNAESMAWRLDAIAPDLARRLQRQPRFQLRRVAERVALAALEEAQPQDARLAQAVDALRAGRYGDSGERGEVKELVDELDKAAWNLRGNLQARGAGGSEYLVAFRRARAAMALWFALDGDPLAAAMEAAYEAEAAMGDRRLGSEIDAALPPAP
jgi:hypothetical protein